MRLAAWPRVPRDGGGFGCGPGAVGTACGVAVGPEHSAMVAVGIRSGRVPRATRLGADGEEAQVFERRLYEAVPTGWFVSPNIFSTVILGQGLVCLGLSWSRRAWWLAVLGAAWLLLLAGSKGALAAFGLRRLGVLLAAIGARGATVGA